MVAVKMLLAGVFFVGTVSFSEGIKDQPIPCSIGSVAFDSLPGRNQQVLNYVIHNGSKISPTYQSSVCTELLIGVLKNFTLLSKEDKNRIRIITEENVHELRLNNSPIPKGVYYALTESKKGITINSLQDARPGDFVQFWYWSWGHCGIVKSIDAKKSTMELYSSYPSTNGYGIQTFNIPGECYFVRLK
ncbi:MAG: hypothetical protein JWM14_1672 [Chitinophagaceae bacterium]|nr:hypothetical protein [Chitinophagaceae bacterium]